MIKNKSEAIRTLFLDIGGVLLTNGWGRTSRKEAVKKFGLDDTEIEERHHLTFDTYEEGKLTLDQYLDRVIFHEPRNFSKEDFKAFMFSQSQLLGDNLAFFKDFKAQHGLKVVAVSNEGRELNEHRIQLYDLNSLFDAYISSCYIHIRKPDKDVLRMACDISQTHPDHALYIDDRLMFVEVARAFGIEAIHFKDLDTVKEQIKKFSFHKAEKKS